jgi:hypothetical protein
MTEEPVTPKERARFIVARIESAMRDFSEMHPRLRDRRGRRVHGSYRWLSVAVPAHYEPVSEVDWTLSTPRAVRAAKLLSCALTLYVEGKLSLSRVKKYYQLFADSHLVYWVGGRMFYTEGAARLAAIEGLNERIRVSAAAVDTAPVAHPLGEVAPPRRGPRLAYSRGRTQVND